MPGPSIRRSFEAPESGLCLFQDAEHQEPSLEGLTRLSFLYCVSFPLRRRLFLKILAGLCRTYKERAEGFIPAKSSQRQGVWAGPGGSSRQDDGVKTPRDKESMGEAPLSTPFKPSPLMPLPLAQPDMGLVFRGDSLQGPVKLICSHMCTLSHWLNLHWGLLGTGSRLALRVEMQLRPGPVLWRSQVLWAGQPLVQGEVCCERCVSCLGGHFTLFWTWGQAHQKGSLEKAVTELGLQPREKRQRGCREPSNRAPGVYTGQRKGPGTTGALIRREEKTLSAAGEAGRGQGLGPRTLLLGVWTSS